VYEGDARKLNSGPIPAFNEDLHDNVDYTPYEGMQLQGWPIITLLRGEVVWNDGALLDVAAS